MIKKNGVYFMFGSHLTGKDMMYSISRASHSLPRVYLEYVAERLAYMEQY